MEAEETRRQWHLGVLSTNEYVQALEAERDRLREFVKYVRDGMCGHVSDECIERVDELLASQTEHSHAERDPRSQSDYEAFGG